MLQLPYATHDIWSTARDAQPSGFVAWKSLQTLPGFSNFSFNYTVTDPVLSEAAGRAYEKWLHEVRNPNAVYRPETLLDSNGRWQQDIFQRLRTERDDKRILLAE